MEAAINGAKIHYVDVGDHGGLAVVFLHGFPFSHEMWTPQVSQVGRIFRAIAYDMRGHGRSDIGEGQYTIEGHVDDLVGLIDYLKLEKVVVVGLSMGGYITLRALERNPERFKAAVLCDTRSVADTDEGKLKRAADVAFVKEVGSEDFADRYVKILFAPKTFRTNQAAVQTIHEIVAKTSPLSISGTLLALAGRTDTTASLPQIKIPTLLLVGEYDLLTPPAESQAMHDRIQGSELHVIPEAAHMSNLENPEFFNEKLLRFLERVSSMKTTSRG